MRAIWKGVVSFGLVTIPIRLHGATEQHDVPLRQVHAPDGGRVRYQRVCEIEGVEIPYSEVARGYELPDGQVVVLDEEDLTALPITSSHRIEIQRFVPAEQIDRIYLTRSYYLQAHGPGDKPYVLLRDALEQAGTVALVKVALRQRETLAILRPFGHLLVLQTMFWPDEIRDGGDLAPPEDVGIRPQELAVATSYIDTLTGDFDPAEFSDDYAAALREVVEAKILGQEVVTPSLPAAVAGEGAIDLVAALEASVVEAKRTRAVVGAGAKGGSALERPRGPRKTARKKTGAAAATAESDEETRAAPAKKAALRKTSRSTTEHAASRKKNVRKSASSRIV